ncbi:MAG: formyl transferase [Acidobacteriota bacterium]
MRKKIAILGSDDAHHKYLVALLRSRFDVAAVVIEPAASQRRRLRQNGRYHDYAYAIYHHLRRTVFRLNKQRRRYFADLVETPAAERSSVLTVDWINDPSVSELLRNVRPELTVIICTSILKKEVLEAAGELIINVHGGYLPYYRGNHCFFFALYNRTFDRIGSTLHFVDEGIDTGDIIEVVTPPIYKADTAETLYCRAEKLAIHRLADLLDRWQQGESLPRSPQTMRGRLYKTRDRKPHHDLILWFRRFSNRLATGDCQWPPEKPFTSSAGI